MRRDRSAMNGDEGFVLLELLVVMIIIGALATVVIPVFLNERRKAWDTTAKADLRNASTAETSYLAANGTYTTVWAELVVEGFNQSSGVSTNDTFGHTEQAGTLLYNPSHGTNSYCLAVQSKSGRYYWYDSRTGFSATVGC